MADYSLGALVGATGAAAYNLSSCNGGLSSQASFADFKAIATGISGPTQLPMDDISTFAMNFTNEGSRFAARIKGRSDNYSWYSSDENILVLQQNNGNTADFFSLDKGVVSVFCDFNDGFNDPYSEEYIVEVV